MCCDASGTSLRASSGGHYLFCSEKRRVVSWLLAPGKTGRAAEGWAGLPRAPCTVQCHPWPEVQTLSCGAHCCLACAGVHCVWFVVQCCAFFLVRRREHAMRTARRAVRAKAAALHAGCQRRGAEHLQCHGARRARLDAGSAQRGVRDALPGGRPPCAPLRTAYRCRTITQIRNQNKILYTR